MTSAPRPPIPTTRTCAAIGVTLREEEGPPRSYRTALVAPLKTEYVAGLQRPTGESGGRRAHSRRSRPFGRAELVFKIEEIRFGDLQRQKRKCKVFERKFKVVLLETLAVARENRGVASRCDN